MAWSVHAKRGSRCGRALKPGRSRQVDMETPAKTYGLQICRVCGHIVRAAQGSQSREGAYITVSDKGYTR
jgi:RNase P subunit RPR2